MSIQSCVNLKFEYRPLGSHHKFIMEATPLQLKQQFGILGIIRDTKEANNTILNSIEGLQNALKNVQAAHEVLSVYLNEEQHIKEQLKKAKVCLYLCFFMYLYFMGRVCTLRLCRFHGIRI